MSGVIGGIPSLALDAADRENKHFSCVHAWMFVSIKLYSSIVYISYSQRKNVEFELHRAGGRAEHGSSTFVFYQLVVTSHNETYCNMHSSKKPSAHSLKKCLTEVVCHTSTKFISDWCFNGATINSLPTFFFFLFGKTHIHTHYGNVLLLLIWAIRQLCVSRPDMARLFLAWP